MALKSVEVGGLCSTGPSHCKSRGASDERRPILRHQDRHIVGGGISSPGLDGRVHVKLYTTSPDLLPFPRLSGGTSLLAPASGLNTLPRRRGELASSMLRSAERQSRLFSVLIIY